MIPHIVVLKNNKLHLRWRIAWAL